MKMWTNEETSRLQDLAWPVTVEYHSEIDSTNVRARMLIEQESLLPALVVAGTQTAGKGRRSKAWWSPPGALLCTFALDAVESPQNPHQTTLIGLWAGIAVAESLRRIESELEVWVKWPNDVMGANGKLAGLLVESVFGPNQEPKWLIGIGININNSLREMPSPVIKSAGFPGTSLFDLTGRNYSLLSVLESVVFELKVQFANRRQAAPPICDLWPNYCGLTGKNVEVSQNDGQTTIGRCDGIREDGALLISASDGQVIPLHSGSVVSWNQR